MKVKKMIYPSNNQQYNMKPRLIYCPNCHYREISDEVDAHCRQCGHFMFTYIKSIMPNKENI